MRRDPSGVRRRVRVDEQGREGYIQRFTHECSGCTESDEYGGQKFGPFGCGECGGRGVRRHAIFIPFDVNPG